MKKLLLLGLMLFVCVTLSAQNEVAVQITNHKGKAFRNASIYLKSAPDMRKVNRSGEITVDAQSIDTLYIVFSSNKAIVPLQGQTEIKARINKTRAEKILDGGETQQLEVVKIPKFNSSDLQQSDLTMFRDIRHLFMSRYPNVQIIGNNAYIRGNHTANGRIPALMVLDRTPMGSFGQINAMVPIFEVKSVNIRRKDVIYGARGAGGVIEINTIGGRR